MRSGSVRVGWLDSLGVEGDSTTSAAFYFRENARLGGGMLLQSYSSS